jgi:hypothetical protein
VRIETGDLGGGVSHQPSDLIGGDPLVYEIRDEPVTDPVSPEDLRDLEFSKNLGKRSTELGDVERFSGHGTSEDVLPTLRLTGQGFEILGESSVVQVL